ncbi:MAG TPA: hypothetical protein VM782_04295 [Stellaceae bacterium]|nr:hypothetical protein [Stellaceae bacterium]
MRSGYVLAGYELGKLEFWWWYAWAVRAGFMYPFRQALRMHHMKPARLVDVWPIDW